MPSDMAGIYNSRRELTRPGVARKVPKSQLHILQRKYKAQQVKISLTLLKAI